MKGETTDITDLQVVRGELRAVAFLSSIVAEERFIVLTFRLKSAIYCQQSDLKVIQERKRHFEKALVICPSRRQDKIKSRTHPPYGALCPA